MAHLSRHVDHRAALVQQQRAERVPQRVRRRGRAPRPPERRERTAPVPPVRRPSRLRPRETCASSPCTPPRSTLARCGREHQAVAVRAPDAVAATRRGPQPAARAAGRCAACPSLPRRPFSVRSPTCRQRSVERLAAAADRRRRAPRSASRRAARMRRASPRPWPAPAAAPHRRGGRRALRTIRTGLRAIRSDSTASCSMLPSSFSAFSTDIAARARGEPLRLPARDQLRRQLAELQSPRGRARCGSRTASRTSSPSRRERHRVRARPGLRHVLVEGLLRADEHAEVAEPPAAAQLVLERDRVTLAIERPRPRPRATAAVAPAHPPPHRPARAFHSMHAHVPPPGPPARARAARHPAPASDQHARPEPNPAGSVREPDRRLRARRPAARDPRVDIAAPEPRTLADVAGHRQHAATDRLAHRLRMRARDLRRLLNRQQRLLARRATLSQSSRDEIGEPVDRRRPELVEGARVERHRRQRPDRLRLGPASRPRLARSCRVAPPPARAG